MIRQPTGGCVQTYPELTSFSYTTETCARRAEEDLADVCKVS